jgi:hypothetical protein
MLASGPNQRRRSFFLLFSKAFSKEIQTNLSFEQNCTIQKQKKNQHVCKNMFLTL